jgi:hypothetical protein
MQNLPEEEHELGRNLFLPFTASIQARSSHQIQIACAKVSEIEPLLIENMSLSERIADGYNIE